MAWNCDECGSELYVEIVFEPKIYKLTGTGSGSLGERVDSNRLEINFICSVDKDHRISPKDDVWNKKFVEWKRLVRREIVKDIKFWLGEK
jgi:hypothetical protein